ncbi:hypothetical protein [Bradyrhizobium sp. AUGA SZCCT0182]|uniref:hypothetical protein n=1 Tax=Bradyrhizobium sp. AUGA SZCCT0182 TaxID=2807667 RepID=UPI001BA86BAE|nr:hypothetical protein [Bradyrhizobium sp. AUGA SZCCT0182]MBR1236627.1 hypothetical protein [Bradyrhizobium sp. AUGA SZCCT0182]
MKHKRIWDFNERHQFLNVFFRNLLPLSVSLLAHCLPDGTTKSSASIFEGDSIDRCKEEMLALSDDPLVALLIASPGDFDPAERAMDRIFAAVMNVNTLHLHVFIPMLRHDRSEAAE